MPYHYPVLIGFRVFKNTRTSQKLMVGRPRNETTTWIFIELWMATNSWAFQKQALDREWSHLFCSRLWVGRSKGPKPVARKGTLLKTSAFQVVSPINNNLLCHNCPTYLSHKCPIPTSMLNFKLCVCWIFPHNEHPCASWCWGSPTWHTTPDKRHMWCCRCSEN